MRKNRNNLNHQSGSVVVILVLLIAAAVGLYFYFGKANLPLPQNIISLPNTSLNTSAKTTEHPNSSAQVLITADGFIPASLTVIKGQQVTWINQDSKSHQITPFPKTAANTLAGPEDSDILDPNDSFTFTFENTGTFTYHDELNPSKLKGTVIVNN